MLNKKKRSCNHVCAHDGLFAVISGVRGSDESSISEPQILCQRCGACRFRYRAAWSPSLDEELAADPKYRFPEGAALFVHARGLTEESADDAAKKAFDAWVDVGGYGRRLLFGRLRADEVERAERDAAIHAGMPAADFDRMKEDERRLHKEAQDRLIQQRFEQYGRRPAR